MKKAILIVGAGEKSADLLYLTRLSTPDDFLFFAVPGESYAVVNPLELSRALVQVPKDVAVVNSVDWGKNEVEVIKYFVRQKQVDILEVPPDFPLGLADALRNAGLTVTAKPGVFLPQREFKKLDEIAQITLALRAAEAATQAGIDAIRSCSVNAAKQLVLAGEIFTSEKLRAIVDGTLLQHQAMGIGTICSSGLDSALPHCEGAGPILAQTPIVMDVFPRLKSSGYWGDLTRTVVKGKAPEIVKKAFEAVKAARDESKKLLKPGANPRDIHLFAAQILADRHFLTGTNDAGAFGFFHGLGHGVGLDIHEAPRLSPGNDKPLAGGEVVTVEPGLYYPEWGGIRLEDLVTIEPDGCRTLTELETVLELE